MTVRLSDSVKVLLADSLTADQLYHLAAVKRALEPAHLARQQLDADALEELATMALEGRRATVGWWRRHTTANVR